MSVAAFLSDLRRRDIRVWVDGDKLRCDARAGALTDGVREELRSRKEELVSFLRMAQAAATQDSAIVPLQPNGAKIPVFAIPGHSGDVFSYRALARCLGEDRPFFALQPPGLDGRSEPLERVEEVAAHFAKAIRTFRPQGPWIIGGYCMGGTTAFELARQLHAAGGSVAFIAMFGVPFPRYFEPLNMLHDRMAFRMRGWHRRVRVFLAQSNRERLDYITWRLGVREQASDPVLQQRTRLEAVSLAAVRAYEPQPLPVRIHHYVPNEAWARRRRTGAQRWSTVATLAGSYAGPEGCTADDMLLERHAPLFAEHFKRSCALEGV
jgi:thioesterase domain-containing protein